MLPLAEFQGRVRDALLQGTLDSVAGHVASDPATLTPLEPAERLEIHANNVLITLADALAANFPVTACVTGADFFTAAATAFVRAHPPRIRSLIAYGAGFPDFVAGFRGASSLPYLGDIARLDWACTTAYHGPEATPVSVADLAAIPESAWPAARFRFHPTVALLRSAFPIDAIWRAHQGAAPEDWTIDLGAGPAHVIVARPQATVEVMSVPAGIFALVMSLMSGAPLSTACECAADSDPAFDPTTALAACLGNQIVASVRFADDEKARS